MNFETGNRAPQIISTDTMRPEFSHPHGDHVKEVPVTAKEAAINKIVCELQDDSKRAEAVKDLKELLNGKSDHEKEKLAKIIRHRQGSDSADTLDITPLFDQSGRKTGQSEISIAKRGETIQAQDAVDKIKSRHPFKNIVTLPWRAIEALIHRE